MSAQRYQQISSHDEDEDTHITSPNSPRRSRPHQVPSSPPPSFRSRNSSSTRRRTSHSSDQDPLVSEADRTLADTFDVSSDSDSEEEDGPRGGLDERQRAMSGRPTSLQREDDSRDQSNDSSSRPGVERRVTQLPVFAPASSNRHTERVNDGVFANLSAKPERGEDPDEKPPSYEQAAADATPPYWENTILAPTSSATDEVFIDGLPVGSFFSFFWNGLISMSFQLVGFLLTYLLHTTHAAKNGSKAGLGIILVQYGFSMKGASSGGDGDNGGGAGGSTRPGADGNVRGGAIAPTDPNSHDFNPNKPIDGTFIPNANANNGAGSAAAAAAAAASAGGSGGSGSGLGALTATDWFAYALMIVGWFVLIRAVSEYLKARRHEALVMQSPSRGLNVAVVAEGEEPDRSV